MNLENFVESLSTESYKGYTDLLCLTNRLGYSSLQEFLMDNPGSIESIYNWVLSFYNDSDLENK